MHFLVVSAFMQQKQKYRHANNLGKLSNFVYVLSGAERSQMIIFARSTDAGQPPQTVRFANNKHLTFEKSIEHYEIFRFTPCLL